MTHTRHGAFVTTDTPSLQRYNRRSLRAVGLEVGMGIA